MVLEQQWGREDQAVQGHCAPRPLLSTRRVGGRLSSPMAASSATFLVYSQLLRQFPLPDLPRQWVPISGPGC